MLSPMAGFTDAPTRLIASRFGAARTFTEMANAAGLAKGAGASWVLLETLPDEPRPVAHLYGADPDAFAAAAEKIAATERFSGIDINAGCPAPKVVREGAGSALMRQPALVGRIVAAAKAASGLPVSVKTRIGYTPSDITVFALLEEAEAAGASALSVHGRYRAQGHTGPVAFDIVAEVKRRASIPIYGNGGVRDAATAEEFFARTGVDGLLVGQGAIGHPWVFREIRDGVSFQQGLSRATVIPLDEIRAVLLEHLDLDFAFINDLAAKYPALLADDTPEMLTVIRFRLHLFRYLSGLKGVSRMRGRLSTVRSLDEVRRAIDDCLDCEAFRRARRNR
jgi:nifR3 family TIM-barrel protein